MRVEIDNEDHCGEFIRLNESWIEEHFSLEEVDRTLAEDPFRIIELARKDGAETVYLLSNTVLKPAIALYRKHGFHSLSEGPHPVYARCNIVMERSIEG